MGQQQSNQTDLITDQFNLVRTLSPTEFWVRRKNKPQEFQLRILTFYLQQQMQEYMRFLDRRRKLKNPHLLQLIEHTPINQQTLCAATFKIRTLVEYPFKSIADQIQQRTTSYPKRYFGQDEIWSILYSCSQALNSLYLNRFSHEGLTTSQILVDWKGIIKLADCVVARGQKNHLALLDQNTVQPTARYISPELVNLVEDNHFYLYDKQLSDVYILALITLEICNLEPVKYYQRLTKKFEFQASSVALKGAGSRYSQELTELLARMLALDFKLRPKFEDILTYIRAITVNTQSSQKSMFSNETKSNKVDNHPNGEKQPVKSNIKRLEYQKHDRQWSLPPSNITNTTQGQSSTHLMFKPVNQYPQLIPTNSILKFQSKTFNQPLQNCVSTNVPANIRVESDLKITTDQRKAAQNQPEIYTPYMQLLNLTSKTNLDQPSISYNVTKVQSMVSLPSQKPKISFKFNNSPIKVSKKEISNGQTASSDQLQLNNMQNLRFSEAKFGKIELQTPNLNQFPTQNHKQPLKIDNQPLKSVPSSTQPIFVIEQYEQGRFQGFKLNNQRSGVGKLIYSNGSYYQGEWKDDNINGFGKLCYSDGQTAYEGHWRNSSFYGTGTLYNQDPKFDSTSIDYNDLSSIESRWVSYDGQFEDHEKHGNGTLLLANGQTFSGIFKRGVAQGEGSYYKSSGEVIRGRWHNNLYIGGV